MGKPTMDEETRAAFFHGPDPSLFDDPVCGAELRRLAREDPDIIAAVADEDRTLIQGCMERTPAQQLHNACEGWRAIARMRGGR